MTQPLYTFSFQCTIWGLFVIVCACAGDEYRVSSVTMCFLTSPKFCYSRFGWNSRKTEETLQPVLKQLSTQQVKTSYCIDCIYLSLYKNLQCCWFFTPLLTTNSNENHQDQNQNSPIDYVVMDAPTCVWPRVLVLVVNSSLMGGVSRHPITVSSVQSTHHNHFLD